MQYVPVGCPGVSDIGSYDIWLTKIHSFNKSFITPDKTIASYWGEAVSLMLKEKLVSEF